MKKEFLDFDSMAETFSKVLTDAAGDDACRYESFIEEFAWMYAEESVSDMRKYVHQKDTRMSGNFCNIREDWEYTSEFIGSEVKPWGKFDDVVKSVDDGTISDEDLKKLQTWCGDWFFRAFGTWGIKYNFQSFIADMEYEEEREEERKKELALAV